MLNTQAPNDRLPEKIPVKSHTQVRPNLEPRIEGGGLTPESAARASGLSRPTKIMEQASQWQELHAEDQMAQRKRATRHN
jgi:hypothetical protein